MKSLVIGFTGTRHGMSQIQKDIVRKLLQDFAGSFHHGDCVGADAEAHAIAKELNYMIAIHPPINPRWRAFCQGDFMYPPKDYIPRNHDIVQSCQYLIATPATMT